MKPGCTPVIGINSISGIVSEVKIHQTGNTRIIYTIRA